MTKITDLSVLAGAGVDQANDVLPIVDVSETGIARNKKITIAELLGLAATVALQASNNLSDVANAATSRTNLGVGTGDSPQFTGINLGHASDTTLTRTGAGDAAIEGNAIYRAGGTDVPVTDGGTGASTASGARTNLGATTVGANIFTITNPSAITFLRLNADNSVDALSAAAFRTAIGAGTGSGSGDMVAANNLSDLANISTALGNLGFTADAKSLVALANYAAMRTALGAAVAGAATGSGLTMATARILGRTTASSGAIEELTAGAGLTLGSGTLKLTDYSIGFFFTTVPIVSEVLLLHVAGAAFTIPANFSAGLQSSVGTNPTASFALDVQKNGSTIGTITVSTGGVVSATTVGGTSKSIAAGDVIKIIAPSPVDATAANMAFTIIGAR